MTLPARHTRRAFLRWGIGGAAATAALAACGSPPAPPRPPGPPVFGADLRMSLFGTAQRQKRVQQALARYTAQFGGSADVQIVANTSYGQKIATEMAGGAAADVVSLFHNIVADYARRDVLVPLDQWADVLDLSTLDQAAAGGGVIQGRRVAIPLGDNAYAAFYDKGRLDALGFAVPEPGHTWDDFQRFANDVSRAAGPGYWGTVDASGDLNFFEVFLRQRGAALYGERGGLGFTEADLAEWFGRWDELRRDEAAPPGGVTAESLTGGFGTTLIVGGQASNFFIFGNVLKGFQGLTESELAISTPPMDDPGASGLFVRASNWVAAYSRGPNVDDAVNAIQFLVNDPEAASTIGVEFGAPVNLAFRSELTYEGADRAFIDYVDLVARTYAQPVPSLDVEFPEGAAQVQTAFLAMSQSIAGGDDSLDEGVSRFVAQAEGLIA
jgi:pectin-derived oligosaccharide transport system substrate-binding protein